MKNIDAEIGDKIDALIDSVPEEAWDKLPDNLAATIDKRLYGTDMDKAVRDALEMADEAFEAAFVNHLRDYDDPIEERLRAFTVRLSELGFVVIEAGLVPEVVRIRALASYAGTPLPTNADYGDEVTDDQLERIRKIVGDESD